MLEPYGREQQAIRERAYAIWQQEGCPDDRTLSNWLQAEAEIKGEEVFGPNIRKKVSDRHREIGRSGRKSRIDTVRSEEVSFPRV
jgi:hypothetical protein